jgi:hypothetical protein
LVLRPEAVADVRVAEEVGVAVPVPDPGVVWRFGAEERDVSDGGGGAPIDAGDVAAGA